MLDHKKRAAGAVLSLMALFMAASCGTKNSKTTGYTFTDYEGEKTVEYKPDNVALLYPSFGDMWLATGGTISIGVEDCVSRGYASEDITIVGEGTGKTIDMEALVAAKPDFVILSHDFPNHDDYAKSLSSYGISYAIFEFESYQDYLDILKAFSGINQNEEAYETYGVSQKASIDAIIEKAKAKTGKKVLLLRATNSKVSALSASNFVGSMLNDLGCTNIADTNSTLSTDLSTEIIVKENPDIILCTPMGNAETAFGVLDDTLSTEPWSSLTAVKEGRVIKLEKDLYHYKPNTRWAEAYELLYSRIYTEE